MYTFLSCWNPSGVGSCRHYSYCFGFCESTCAWILLIRGPCFLGILYYLWLLFSFHLLSHSFLNLQGQVRGGIWSSCLGLSISRFLTLKNVCFWVSVLFKSPTRESFSSNDLVRHRSISIAEDH